ncbi:MAG: polyribonucleotide nucleotidyltransferase [Bacteroidetes bacterium]|nr:polyribonucleotide nucleotidyltransferase [Bacteroidota bacterium]
MKPNKISKIIDLGEGKVIEIETGLLAKQAHGSVVVKQGKTMLLATVVSNHEAKEDIDFLPLSVDYQEKFAAVGRIPGSFLKREGRLSDYEILISRLVDRALRPLFPEDYHCETQVAVTLISSDENIMPDALAGLAASAAIAVSDIPFNGPISEVRVGRIDGKLVVNPTKSELENSDIDIIIAGTINDINMVEGEMSEVQEADLLEALKFGHAIIKKQCQAQIELKQETGKTQIRDYAKFEEDSEMLAKIKNFAGPKIAEVAKSASEKGERSQKIAEIKEQTLALFADDETVDMFKVKTYYGQVEWQTVREVLLDTKMRLDGRTPTQIRPIWSEVDYLPAAHGSAVFTRGETQALASVTLGSKLDEQLLDSPMNHGYGKLMLHYNFPAFSTGEVRPNRGPGRREIGHGNLALRGLKKVLPADVPYTIRIVSDVLESNGSSSMATVCSGTLALMDAGIQISRPVSGIAMGMISDESTGRHVVLSDILGDEDHLGDMDFKVVGTEKGITACQMDIKINGLSYETLAEALNQSKEGRLHILGEMNKTLSAPRAELKPHAPRIEKLEVPKDYIGAIIGSGGKVIQEIQAQTNTVITIDEVDGKGLVEISSPDGESIAKALTWIKGIITEPEVGEVYHGKVKTIVEFGAFVEFMPGKEGLLHISEIDWKRLPSMEGVYQVGDEVDVKLLDIDKKSGKFKLSHKALLPRPQKQDNQ